MILAYLLLSLSVTSGMPRERACSLVRSEVGMHTMSLSSPDFNYTVREGKRKEREREEGRERRRKGGRKGGRMEGWKDGGRKGRREEGKGMGGSAGDSQSDRD
jgi:hypothetical protein